MPTHLRSLALALALVSGLVLAESVPPSDTGAPVGTHAASGPSGAYAESSPAPSGSRPDTPEAPTLRADTSTQSAVPTATPARPVGQSNSQPKPKASTKAKATPKPKAKVKPGTKTKPATKAKPGTKTKPGTKVKATAKPKTKAGSKAKPKATTGSKGKPQASAIPKATPKAKATPRPTAAPQPRAKPRPAARPRPKTRPGSVARRFVRNSPGPVTTSHYLRRLTGRSHDRAAMYALGVHDAQLNRGNPYALVLLDIGGQVNGGVKLSATDHYVSYRALRNALAAYLDGYRRGRSPRLPVLIAVGTNNDLQTSRAAGALWARQVINPLRRHVGKDQYLQVIGANDIEPGFSASYAATRQWVAGYLEATPATLVYNGSADGCSTRQLDSSCNHGWTARGIATLAGLAAPSRILVLPQIYNLDMAAQWAMIGRTATHHGHHPLRFLGPLTETAACGRDRSCPTMSSRRAWMVLWHALRSSGLTTLSSLPVQTDLDIR